MSPLDAFPEPYDPAASAITSLFLKEIGLPSSFSPTFRMWLDGKVKVEIDAGILLRVTLPDDYDHLHGVVRTILEDHGVEFDIVAD